MPSSEYPDAVIEYIQDQGWTTNLIELREGAYIVAGERERDSNSEEMLLMIVCEPEEKVSSKFIEFLIKVGREKGINSVMLTYTVRITDDAQEMCKKYRVDIIDSQTVQSHTKSSNFDVDINEIKMPGSEPEAQDDTSFSSNLEERAKQIVEHAEGSKTTEALLLGQKSSSEDAEQILADQPLIEYLYEDESPEYIFWSDFKSFALPDRNLDPGTDFRAVCAITDQRVIYVVGTDNGDRVVSIPYNVLTEVESSIGWIKDRLSVNAAEGTDDKYDFYVSNDSVDSSKEVEKAADLIREKIASETGDGSIRRNFSEKTDDSEVSTEPEDNSRLLTRRNAVLLLGGMGTLAWLSDEGDNEESQSPDQGANSSGNSNLRGGSFSNNIQSEPNQLLLTEEQLNGDWILSGEGYNERTYIKQEEGPGENPVLKTESYIFERADDARLYIRRLEENKINNSGAEVDSIEIGDIGFLSVEESGTLIGFTALNGYFQVSTSKPINKEKTKEYSARMYSNIEALDSSSMGEGPEIEPIWRLSSPKRGRLDIMGANSLIYLQKTEYAESPITVALDPKTGEKKWSLSEEIRQFGNYLASTNGKAKIDVHDPSTGNQILTLPLTADYDGGPDIYQDTIYHWGRSVPMQVYDLNSGEQVRTIEHGGLQDFEPFADNWAFETIYARNTTNTNIFRINPWSREERISDIIGYISYNGSNYILDYNELKLVRTNKQTVELETVTEIKRSLDDMYFQGLTEEAIILTSRTNKKDQSQIIFAIDREDGTERWNSSDLDPTYAGPPIIVTKDGIYTQNAGYDPATGEVRWELERSPYVSVEMFAYDGTILIADNKITAIDQITGDVNWTYRTGFPVTEAAFTKGTLCALASNGILYTIGI